MGRVGRSRLPAFVPVPAWVPQSVRGYGANVTGGANQTVVHVTNTDDSGAGSFRDAVGTSNRFIVFDVAGEIALATHCYMDAVSNITIDGTSAPSPGITLTGHPLYLRNGTANVIIRNIRHRGGWDGTGGSVNDADCITITRGCDGVVVQNVSLSGYYDEGVGIWGGATAAYGLNRNITVQDCLIGPGDAAHNFPMLVGGNATNQSHRVTVYRNLITGGAYRNPAIGYDDAGTNNPSDLVGHVVNNVVWDWIDYGITVYWRANAVVEGNYTYTAGAKAGTGDCLELWSSPVVAYVSGNYSLDGGSFDASTMSRWAIDAYADITPTTAATARADVYAYAGCFPRDATDLSYLAEIAP